MVEGKKQRSLDARFAEEAKLLQAQARIVEVLTRLNAKHGRESVERVVRMASAYYGLELEGAPHLA